MPTQIEYALMAANVYGVSPQVKSTANTLSEPRGWLPVDPPRTNPSTGFMARAYRNALTNEVVISYCGTTTENDLDWLQANIPAGLGLLAPQVVDAARFYLDVRAQLGEGAQISRMCD
jgi:hypothetical protein